MDTEEKPEDIEGVGEEVESEVEEERARVDEVTHEDDTRVLDAIEDLARKLDGLRDMMSVFVDAGAVVTEVTEDIDEPNDVVFDADGDGDIDMSVIEDISNVKFSDDYKMEDEED